MFKLRYPFGVWTRSMSILWPNETIKQVLYYEFSSRKMGVWVYYKVPFKGTAMLKEHPIVLHIIIIILQFVSRFISTIIRMFFFFLFYLQLFWIKLARTFIKFAQCLINYNCNYETDISTDQTFFFIFFLFLGPLAIYIVYIA